MIEYEPGTLCRSREDFASWWESEDREDGTGVLPSTRWRAFWGDTLGMCSCGTDSTPRLAARLLLALYLGHEAGKHWSKHFDGDRSDLTDLLLHVFGARGVTDHGSTAYGSFLTPKGSAWARFLFRGGDLPSE